MATERTDGNGEGGMDMAERYAGPSAKRIADLLPHRVSYERGWFWTTTRSTAAGRTGWRSGRDRTARASTCGATPGAALAAWC